MSWDNDDDARKDLRRWLGDFIPEELLIQIEEMMERMMSEMNQGTFIDPEKFQEIMRNQEGINPFMSGFSLKLGPDGKPVMQRFGNMPGNADHTLEPLVDVVEDEDEIIVVAEIPGVERDQIKVRIKGTTLTIHADNAERPYHKEIELPARVKKDDAKSAIRNGILEVRLKKE